jgi:GR25 family glycosyltransferase involved in LPS biosynthesis
MEQTLKRANKYWRLLKKASRKKGQVPVDGPLMEEFIEACMQTRAITDDYLILAKTKGQKVVKRKKKRKTKKKARKKAKKKASKKARKKARKKAKKKGGRK